MPKLPYKQSLLAGAATLAIIGTVFAQGPVAKAEDAQQSAADRQATQIERQEQRQTRLADAKLKACQRRETAVNNILTRIADRGEKQLAVFDKIAERTKAFYLAKGKTLSNYDALVAEVDAKRTAAETALEEVKATSVTFKCDGTDPKGAAASFKASLKSEIAALKAYKTAVKNLIVGVKSVQSATTGSETEGAEQ